jgi:hypothetical protein
MVPDLIQPSLEIRQLADAVYKTLHEATALLRNALAP